MGPAPVSYLDRYDREPAETKWKLFRQFMADDPIGLFLELRTKRPILVTPEWTLVALYDDVVELLNMPDIFTVKLYEPKMSNNYMMMHDDDAIHYREKSLMQAMLNRDDIAKVRQMVQRNAATALAHANGRIDAVDGYCRLIPATIVRDYFGLIGMHLKELMKWSHWAQVDTFYNQPFDIATPEERRQITESNLAAGKELGKYIAALLVTRTLALRVNFLWAPLRDLWNKFFNKDAPPEDIVTRMLRSKLPPSLDFNFLRVGVNAGGLLIGTIETTAQASVQTIQFLLKRPELLAKAQAAAKLDDPAQFDSIVWEALRFVPISPYMFRQTASAYTLAKGTPREATIPAGTIVLALTQSAMFDEKAFENPAEFQPGRNWYHYFTFGYGAHECLGKYVGMVMIPEIVRQLLLQPNLEAKGDIVYNGHMPGSYELTWKP